MGTSLLQGLSLYTTEDGKQKFINTPSPVATLNNLNPSQSGKIEGAVIQSEFGQNSTDIVNNAANGGSSPYALYNGVKEPTSTDSQQKKPLDYVNATNGQIFMNGILVDDCYDIQYSYRETKEPIYGYNSKYYDKIVGGNVIVHGSFTINYKHDKYLNAILSMGTDGNLQDTYTKINSAEKFNKEYQKSIQDYKILKDSIKKLETDLKTAQDANKVSTAKLTSKQKEIALVNNASNTDLNKKASAVYGDATVDQISVADYTIGEINKAKDEATNKKADVAKEIAEITQNKNNYEIEIRDFETNIKTSQQRIDDANSNFKKNILPQYNVDLITKEANDVIKDLEAQIEVKKNLISVTENGISELKDTVDKINDEYNKKEDDAYSYADKEGCSSSLVKDIQTRKTQFLADSNTADLSAKTKAKEETTAKADLTTSTDKVTKAQKALDDAKKKLAGDSLTKVKDAKAKLNSITVNWSDFDSKTGVSPASLTGRPEDQGEFNIFIRYNGGTHKIIEGATLTGSSHVLAMDGQSVKEYYQFFGKSIKSY